MTREMKEQRWRELPEPIRELGMNEPAINDLLRRYAAGIIVTREEVLCQMVLVLGRIAAGLHVELMQVMTNASRPIIIPRRPAEEGGVHVDG